MASKISPNPWVVAVVNAIGTNNEVARELAAEYQRARAAYDAWEMQGDRNALSVRLATDGLPGAGTMSILRGWPYR